MAKPSGLMGTGVPGLQATEICGTVANGLTATGSTQGTALALSFSTNVVTTTAASTGVILPPVEVGQTMTVANLGASTLTVYPATGQTIQGAAANAGVSLATLKTLSVFGISPTGWVLLGGV